MMWTGEKRGWITHLFRGYTGCLGGAVVGQQTRDRKFAAGPLSSQLGQLSLPSLRGK